MPASPLPVRFEDCVFAFPGVDWSLLDGFSLKVEPGSITALVGPSGCGKSTLLRLAVGLLQPSGGSAEPGRVEPGQAAFVFQQANLLPWRSLAANVALPLELSGLPSAERADRVRQALALVELQQAADQLPGALSGGMRMRASLARAWVGDPRLLVMDEPFSALDALTRRRMHQRFQDLWESSRPTVLMVTHDIDEAVLLADRVVAVAGRPLAIRGQLAVDLPRPRPTSLRHDPALGRLAEQVEAWL